MNIPDNKKVLYWYDTSMIYDLIHVDQITKPLYILVGRPLDDTKNEDWCNEYSKKLYDRLIEYSEIIIDQWTTEKGENTDNFNTHVQWGKHVIEVSTGGSDGFGGTN